MGLLMELEKCPAPLLERLDVWGGREYAEPPDLFCGSSGRLRHLALLNVRFPWDSHLLSRLTTLHISNSYTNDPSAQQVVQILQSCPNLAGFELFLPPDLHVGPIPLEASTVELSRLKRLCLRVHPLITEHLLRRMRIPSCKSFDVNHAEATGPTFSAEMNHLKLILSFILLAASRVSIDIRSTVLEYEAIPKINEDDDGKEEENEVAGLVQRIRIRAPGDRFTDGFALETLSWLLDNIHTPSFSLPVSLNIRELASSPPLTLIINQLSPAITYLNLKQSSALAKTIVSYLAEPFEVVMDGTTTIKWPLPNLTDLSFERCADLEPEFIFGCVQRRAGRGLSLEGSREQREKLPAGLTRICLSHGSSTVQLKRLLPDCREWCGLEQQWEEARARAQAGRRELNLMLDKLLRKEPRLEVVTSDSDD
ncbi:hypothetical protein FRB93_007096 [Tulasnella sp. JGI-2019a]|nr:hypothetical protein FRB93_007096 [Tulasnella sp. JGI-2019a]